MKRLQKDSYEVRDTIANNYFAIQDKYIKVYITCNKFGQTSGGWIDN